MLGTRFIAISLLLVAIIATTGVNAHGDDWPMWRYDSTRSAASPNSVPAKLELLWQRTFSPRKQAWDDPLNLDLMTYDRTFEPVVKDGRMFVGFNDQDKLIAIDTESGETIWTFFTEAPVRLAPVATGDRILVCSDDGFLYCLQAETGKVDWKFTAAPSPQKAIGNQRIVSAWPARGGPVVYDETVYFANSIWPFMGTFICALDVNSGEVRWINDSTGAQYIKQPHSAPSFAGVAPQGALLATEKDLIVPGGRSVPAVFDRETGELRYFHLNEGGKGTGGSFVTADATQFYVHTRERGTRAFDLVTGNKTAFMPNEPVIASDVLFAAEVTDQGAAIRAYPANQTSNVAREALWSIAADGSGDLILAGENLIAAGAGKITVIRLNVDESGSYVGGEIGRVIDVGSSVMRLIVAANKLFAVTDRGEILAYGSTEPALDSALPVANSVADGVSVPQAKETLFVPQVVRTEAAQYVYQLLAMGDAQGFAYWYGPCDPAIASAWAKISPFDQLAIIDSSPERVQHLRQYLDGMGEYGEISVHLSEPERFLAPEYTGQMIFISEEVTNKATVETLDAIYKSLRPYGGTMVLLGDKLDDARRQWLGSLGLEEAEFSSHALGTIIKRVGALPGSADWTHQYGDVANSIKSNDSRVKLPLGILWFGGSSNTDVLPRHGHGPPQQVVGGRLFIEGMNCLSARDVYTGRVLWKRDFGDLGTFDVYYDSTYEDTPLDPKYNQVHIPGANGRGTNYVVTEDRIYLIEGNRCMILDPATGEDVGEVRLPQEESGETAEWGYIAVYEDVLLGGLGFAMYRDRYEMNFDSDAELKDSKKGFGSKSLDRAASRALIGFDRYSGEQLWRVDAAHSFWHNGIVAGAGQVYCLDRNPKMIEEAMRRRGIEAPDTYKIIAVDYRSGETQWEINEGIFGSWLGYSEKHNMLLQAGAKASDRLVDEVGQGMRVYDAGDGSLRWAKDELVYSGPCVLHNDLIITNANSYSVSAGAFYIQTGEPWLVQNSITGLMEPWRITRAYGCNSIVASENLLTFRSGAAGYYDLLNDSGTGNLGGFKSGCTSNLIVANGVLNAPDYTRTCSCAYQNQTSLALVPMPDVEAWTIHPLVTESSPDDTPIQALGLNFGAPGDRRDQDGILWVEHPTVSGEALPLEIEVDKQAVPYLQHASAVVSTPFDWVYASGLEMVSEIDVRLVLLGQESRGDALGAGADLGEYNVELFFASPRSEYGSDGQVRKFEVTLQDESFRETIELGGDARSDDGVIRREFRNVPIKDVLKIRFKPVVGDPVISGIRVNRITAGKE